MLLNFMAGNPAFSYRQMFGILSSIRRAMGASSAGPLVQMAPAQSRKRCSDQLVVSISYRLSIASYRLTSSLRRARAFCSVYCWLARIFLRGVKMTSILSGMGSQRIFSPAVARSCSRTSV